MQNVEATPPKTILGLMTGSSADGLDLCWASFHEDGNRTQFKVLGSAEIEYPGIFKTLFSKPLDLTDQQIIELDLKLGSWLKDVIKNFNYPFDAIASHGQTIKHEPPHFSLQIGNPAYMARTFNKPVIYDFRNADIKVGGQGAPLIPITDKLLLEDPLDDVLALNIGGISNLTIVPPSFSGKDLLAWDCGPGNTLIDKAVKVFSNGEMTFDPEGQIAARGKLNQKLLDFLLQHEFYQLPPPKSAGQEQFGHTYFNEILKRAGCPSGKVDHDVIYTLTDLTAICIADAVHSLPGIYQPRIMHTGGGGVKNKTLMERLEKRLANIKLKPLDISGITAANKEAFGFAYLGYLHLMDRSGNIPSVTGARQEVILGRTCDPDQVVSELSFSSR
jgi:anhydro-N-acetylmuramic acid kinase